MWVYLGGVSPFTLKWSWQCDRTLFWLPLSTWFFKTWSNFIFKYLQETKIIWCLGVGMTGTVTDEPLLYPALSDLKLSDSWLPFPEALNFLKAWYYFSWKNGETIQKQLWGELFKKLKSNLGVAVVAQWDKNLT